MTDLLECHNQQPVNRTKTPMFLPLFTLLLAAAGALAMANLNGTTSDDETDSGMSGDEEQLRKRIKTCWSSITWLIERSINGWGQSSVRPHNNYLYIASVRNGGEQISKGRRNKESTRSIRKYRRYNDRHSKSISGEHGDQTCSERLLLMQQATVILSTRTRKGSDQRNWPIWIDSQGLIARSSDMSSELL